MKSSITLARRLRYITACVFLLSPLAHAQLEDLPAVSKYTRQSDGSVLQQDGVYNVFQGFVQTQGAKVLPSGSLPFTQSTLNNITGRAVMPRQIWDAIGSHAKSYFTLSGNATISGISYGFVNLSSAGEAYKNSNPQDPVIVFFGTDLFTYPGQTPGTSQWYFSFTFKNIYRFAGGNWFFFQEFNAYLWVDINSGSLANGFWAYMIAPGHTSWIFLGRNGNFYDLRDSNKDGINNLPDSEAGAQPMSGYIFMNTPFASDPQGSAWYYFAQFPDANWMLNLKIPNPGPGDWHLVKGPVSTQN